MVLEEGKRYTAIGGKTVDIRGEIEERDRYYFTSQLIEILNLQGKEYEEQMKVLKSHHILAGLVSDTMTPSGKRHQESGKCLGLNTGGLSGEKLQNLLRSFDIDIKNS